MKQSFNEKMAQIAGTQPAQINYRPTAHARIGTDDVKARLMVSAIFGMVTVMICLTLSFVTPLHWALAFPAGLAIFAWWMWREMKDAKDLQRPTDTTQAQQQQSQPTQKHTFTGEMKTGSQIQMIEFDVENPHAVGKFARKVTQFGAGFSERSAKRAGIGQTEWYEMRDQFISRGWAKWKNPMFHRAGVVLLEKGEAWLEQVAKGE